MLEVFQSITERPAGVAVASAVGGYSPGALPGNAHVENPTVIARSLAGVFAMFDTVAASTNDR